MFSGFEIAVHDAEVVRAGDAAGDLDHERHAAGARHRAGRDDVRERLAVEELHHDVRRAVGRLALIEDLDHVRMRDDLRALGFAPESFAHRGVGGENAVHHLHGARPVHQAVVGAVDRRHSALAEDVLDEVPPGERPADERIADIRELHAIEEAIDGVLGIPVLALRAGLHDAEGTTSQPTRLGAFSQGAR